MSACVGAAHSRRGAWTRGAGAPRCRSRQRVEPDRFGPVQCFVVSTGAVVLPYGVAGTAALESIASVGPHDFDDEGEDLGDEGLGEVPDDLHSKLLDQRIECLVCHKSRLFAKFDGGTTRERLRDQKAKPRVVWRIEHGQEP